MRFAIIKSAVLPLADKAMKTNIAEYYRHIKCMAKHTTDEVEYWQKTQLQNLLQHAYKHTKYYKALFNSLQLEPGDFQTKDDLQKLPVLEKQDVLNNFYDLVSDNVQNIPHKKSSTGGSSGDPMPYLLDHRSWSFSNANTIYNWEKTGYRYGDMHIALGSTSLFVNEKRSLKHSLYYKLKNKIGLNGVNMSPEVCKNYIELIKRKKIRFIYGYASAVYLLAKWVLENKEHAVIDVCFTTSEMLTKQYKKTIKAAFNCTILDCYGAHDGGITAFAHQEGYYEVGYNCLVRIDDATNSTRGPALLTDLLNYAMPLINYKLGDELVIDTEKNLSHPYNSQVINQVIGRTSDLIQLNNGNTLTGPGFTVLFTDLPVDYYCIEKINGDTIKCYIKKLPAYNATHEDIIQSTFKKQMGANTNFSIEYTNEIKYTKSGKRLYFLNKHS